MEILYKLFAFSIKYAVPMMVLFFVIIGWLMGFFDLWLILVCASALGLGLLIEFFFRKFK